MKKMSRNNNTKKILIIILALVIGSFIGYRFALAQSGNALKSVVEPGSMTSEASYIIFTDGNGNYYARNGTTGEIEFESTNASQVINNAIGDLTNGGTIFFKNGEYTSLALDVNFSSYTGVLILEGEGSQTILVGAANSVVPCVYVHGATIGTEETAYASLYVRNMKIAANSVNVGADGLKINNIGFVSLENVWFTNSYIGLEVAGSVAGLDAYNVNARYNIIGIEIDEGLSGWAPMAIRFFGCSSRQNTIGIQLSDTLGVSFFGGYIESNYDVGLKLTGTSGLDNIYDIWFENNANYDIDDETLVSPWNHPNYAYPIFLNVARFGADSQWNIYGGEVNASRLTLVAGSKVNFHDVIGYVTENSGNATVSNNQWIAHGLAATPTIITLTPSAYNVTAYVLSTNSTHIQIGLYYTTTGTNVTSSTMIYWHAEV